jgi:DNA-binding NarL/FixJ family response regulator
VAAVIRIAIADDHALFRQGLKALLRGRDDVIVVGEADRVEDIHPLLDRTPCDVLLLDLRMDRCVLAELPEIAARLPVVVVTANEFTDEPMIAMRSGARAVVFKRFAVEMLLDAVRAAVAGEVWMPPALQARFTAGDAGPGQRLTPRELDVVRLVATGHKNADIARRLFVSEDTVKAHLGNVFAKLAVRDRLELALYALRNGLVALHPTDDDAAGQQEIPRK